MTVFGTLLGDLFPLYILIALGFVIGRNHGVERNSLANLSLFAIIPVIAFGFIAQLNFHPAYLLLPVVVFILSTIITYAMLALGRKIYKDDRANLLAICCGSGNCGYLGLPIVMMFFEAHWISAYMLILLGAMVYQQTVMCYVTARGHFSVRESLMNILRYPTIYAIIVALAFSMYSSIELPSTFLTYLEYFKGAYILVGMMLIGTALAQSEKFELSGRFLSLVFLGKFILWPFLVIILITFDKTYTHLFEPEIYKLLLILAIVPTGANVPAFAAQLNLRPDKAATTVLLGTIFALLYIPLFLILSGFY